MTTSEQSGMRLVAVEDLGPSHVAVVKNTPHGALAVGIGAASHLRFLTAAAIHLPRSARAT